MKIIRYITIAALICYFALYLKAIIAPEITFTLAGGEEQNISEVDPQFYQYAMEKYRTKGLLWLALNGLILAGWIFLSRKKVVFGVVAASIGLLCYITFDSIRGLGYTMSQSVSAALEGYGMPILGWNWFYLIALVALPIATMKKAEQGGDGDAEEAV